MARDLSDRACDLKELRALDRGDRMWKVRPAQQRFRHCKPNGGLQTLWSGGWGRGMNNRQNPLFWAFGAGTWAGVHLRISWFMPLLLAGVLYEFHMKLGAAFFAILFVSVLLHEIGHILAARATDGSGDEILMWPLGGLAFVETSSPRSQAITAAAGPLVNLLLCGLFLPAVWASNKMPDVFNPLVIPFTREDFGTHLISELQVLTFWFNWMGFWF